MKKTLITLTVLIIVLALSSVTQCQELPKTWQLALPGTDWALEVAIADQGSVDESIEKDLYHFVFTRTVQQNQQYKAPTLHVVMEPAKQQLDAIGFRNLEKKSFLRSNDHPVKSFERNSTPLLRYSVDPRQLGVGRLPPEFPTLRSIAAYFVRDNTWITIRLASPELKNSDEASFYKIVDSVRFVDTQHPTTAFDYYHKGNPYYLQENYLAAIEPLAKALTLEQQNPCLSEYELRQLLFELTDAYGALHRLEDCKQVLDYGVNKFPEYYPFHWGLASYYANRDDLEKTLTELELVFRYHPKQIPAPPTIDPVSILRTAPFSRFKTNVQFVNRLNQLQKNWLKK